MKIFMDLEMNPTARTALSTGVTFNNEIIEIGAVKLNSDHEEISSFHSYVKPEFESDIRPRITKLTGITWDMVAEAPDFKTALNSFLEWCGEEYEIYAWSETDLHQIRTEMERKHILYTLPISYMVEHWHDFQEEYDKIFYIDRQMSLTRAVELAGLDFEGRAHGALTDARNTANLYRESREGRGFKKLVSTIEEGKQPCTSSLGAIFDFSEFILS